MTRRLRQVRHARPRNACDTPDRVARHSAHGHDREPGNARPRPRRDMVIATGVLCRDRDTILKKKKSKIKENKRKIIYLFILFVLLRVLIVEAG